MVPRGFLDARTSPELLGARACLPVSLGLTHGVLVPEARPMAYPRDTSAAFHIEMDTARCAFHSPQHRD